MRKIVLSLFVLLLTMNAAAAEPMESALKIYESGDYSKAFQAFLPLAEAGNADAQYYLGGLFADGLGVKMNSDKAVQWLNIAIKNKHRGAAFFLAKMYLSGRGVPLDPQKGAHYLAVAEELKTDEDVDEECD